MNRRVLYVRGDESPAPASLAEEFEVTVANGAQCALDLFAQDGPYAVVIAEDFVGDMPGDELMKRLRERWPATCRVLRFRSQVSDPWLDALNACDIDALIEASNEAALVDTVNRQIENAEIDQSEQLLIDQLRFAREAMSSFTEVLESRLEERLVFLETLNGLGVDLHAAESLPRVARVAAEAVSRGFGGRGARVTLFDLGGLFGGESIVGPPLNGATHIVEICDGQEAIGRIVLDISGRLERTTRSERNFLDTVASAVTGATTKLVRSAERNEAQHATILALARLAEYRDDETGQHLERVSAYCRLLSTSLRNEYACEEIDDSFIENIDRSAPLHDIGKVGIADSILLKPGKLDPDEWRIMKTHTDIGAQTLAPIVESSPRGSYLRMGLEIAWCHHERWDGSGYPRGLVGEDIPLSARILALADCYDALTTRRPYKEPWTHEEARKYVVEQDGAHFDPKVVASFLAVEEEFDRIRTMLADSASH